MIVKAQTYSFQKPFFTEEGKEIKTPLMAYEEYGNPRGEVIYILHGAYSHFHAAGKYNESDPNSGFWDALIGEEKAIDTRRFRVIAANALGSMYGSSSPLSLNPDTGKPYGSLFPSITIKDMVRFHKNFLDELGIQKLFLIGGPSMGSMQSLMMAKLYPDFVNSVFAVATGAYLPPFTLALHLFILDFLESDPYFKEGQYKKEEMLHCMKSFQVLSRFIYYNEKYFEDFTSLNATYQEKAQSVHDFLYDQIELAADMRDPNCLIRVIKAMNTYNLAEGYPNLKEALLQIKAKLLLVNFDTDLQLGASKSEEIARLIEEENTNQVWLRNKKSKWGHYACAFDAKNFATDLKDFIQSLSSI